MALVWLALILLVAMTVVYVSVSLYFRSVRKERLENEWDAAPPVNDPAARTAHIAAGMAVYRSSLQRRLIALVYVVPVVIIAAVTYVTNAN